MRDKPLKAAYEALQRATEAVRRAQVYYDYQGNTELNELLSEMSETLIKFQRTLHTGSLYCED